MVEVTIKHDGIIIGQIFMDREGEDIRDHGTYRVKYLIERGAATGLSNRILHSFPRKEYNAFGLLKLALEALNEKELKLERDFDPDEAPVSADMERRQHPALRAIQAGLRGLHNH